MSTRQLGECNMKTNSGLAQPKLPLTKFVLMLGCVMLRESFCHTQEAFSIVNRFA